MSRNPIHRWPIFALAVLLLAGPSGVAQSIFGTLGDPVPADVQTIYRKGLDYLVATQRAEGGWSDGHGQQAGVIALAMMAILAHGEDPNHGPYAETVKRCLDGILKQQNPTNGYIGNSMYNHGFATLGLAEAYGHVQDERIGPALERAVALILSSQESNPYGAWRYSPGANDADTTVSGSCLVALYAAQNAGVAVPPKAIARALSYFSSCACPEGGFGYTGPNGPNGPRSAIGVLVFSLARRYQDRDKVRALEWLRRHGAAQGEHYFYYHLYYAAQALFQADMALWREWNSQTAARLKQLQAEDGSFKGNHGQAFSTASALLSLALNYRFLPIYER